MGPRRDAAMIAGRHRWCPVLSIIITVVFLGGGCKSETVGGLSYTEAGMPFYSTEAGPVYLTEGGLLFYTEAGPVFLEAGPGSGSDAGPGIIDTTCHTITCQGEVRQCGDCKDNDGDGKIDSQDPECLGPCDNTEGPVLLPGVGGQIGSTCHVDCYFDTGNGMGQDSCWWDHQCDPLEPEKAVCPYKPQFVGGKFCPAQQAASCIDYCMPLTPNGCDCFGCCTFPELAGLGSDGKEAFVWIGATDANKNGTCTLASLLDPTKCPRCTPVIPGCYNPCDRCELCVGKTTLPADCFTAPAPKNDAGTTSDMGVPPNLQCPNGEQPCGLPGQALCPASTYCITGCCVELKIE